MVLVWPVGVLTGDDDDGGGSSASSGNGGEQAAAETPAGETPVNTQVRGQAIVAEQEGKPLVVLTAVGLEPTTDNTAYQVWLYNSEGDRQNLGAQVTDAQGNFGVSQALPAGYKRFKFIDVTTATVQGEQASPGNSVMRGQLKLLDKPVTRGTGKNRATLLGQVELVPLPNSG